MALDYNLGAHSWNAYVTHAAKRLTTDSLPGASASSTKQEGGAGWNGCDSLADAVRMASHGWQEGATSVGKALDRVTEAQDLLPDWSMDVGGAFPCVPAYLAGEPECVWRMSEERKQTRRLALIVNGTYHCGVTAAQVAVYARAVAAIARAIESSGIDVAIYNVVINQSRSSHTAGYAVTVREYGEPLDLAKVAFAFHPGFLRRLGFAWRELTPAAVKAGIAANGYGSPLEITPETAHELLGDLGVSAVLSSVGDLHSKRALSDTDTAVSALIELFRTEVDAAIKAAEISGATQS